MRTKKVIKTLRCQKGMSLAEVIVAIMMMIVVSLGLASAFVFGINAWQQAVARNTMQVDGSLAIDRIARLVAAP